MLCFNVFIFQLQKISSHFSFSSIAPPPHSLYRSPYLNQTHRTLVFNLPPPSQHTEYTVLSPRLALKSIISWVTDIFLGVIFHTVSCRAKRSSVILINSPGSSLKFMSLSSCSATGCCPTCGCLTGGEGEVHAYMGVES